MNVGFKIPGTASHLSVVLTLPDILYKDRKRYCDVSLDLHRFLARCNVMSL